MALGISREGIKYNSIDGEPVQLVFLILGPRGQESQHLRFLCSLSRLLRDARIKNSLLAAKTKQEVKDLFSTLENQQTHERHPQVENS
jgi:mannitol/fructose-specific phosphotransferase system IIA component (Ntr-type)